MEPGVARPHSAASRPPGASTCSSEAIVPARSKAQQMAAGAALAAKRGEKSKRELKGAIKINARVDEPKAAPRHGLDEAQGHTGTRVEILKRGDSMPADAKGQQENIPRAFMHAARPAPGALDQGRTKACGAAIPTTADISSMHASRGP
jgi:Protein of unknwon function (DUF3008)